MIIFISDIIVRKRSKTMLDKHLGFPLLQQNTRRKLKGGKISLLIMSEVLVCGLLASTHGERQSNPVVSDNTQKEGRQLRKTYALMGKSLETS